MLALLDERRGNLITQRTRLVNQLHALLRDLIPGGAPARLSATAASRLLTGVRPAGAVEAARKQLARDLIAEIRAADQRLKLISGEIEQAVAVTGSRLSEVDGIGPVIAGRLLGRVRQASRFPTAAAFASYAGVAPVEVASADRSRHRLPRGGDRQLNFTLHLVALTQVRMPGSAGRAYYDTKIAAGKTHNEAMRCLKRRLADHVWRRMIRDEHAQTAGLGGHSGRLSIQRGWLNPDHQLFGQVTSQARQSQPYDHHVRCLTNTEEPSIGRPAESSGRAPTSHTSRSTTLHRERGLPSVEGPLWPLFGWWASRFGGVW